MAAEARIGHDWPDVCIERNLVREFLTAHRIALLGFVSSYLNHWMSRRQLLHYRIAAEPDKRQPSYGAKQKNQRNVKGMLGS